MYLLATVDLSPVTDALITVALSLLQQLAPVIGAALYVGALFWSARYCWIQFKLLVNGGEGTPPDWVFEEWERGHGAAEWGDYQEWANEQGVDSWDEENYREWEENHR